MSYLQEIYGGGNGPPTPPIAIPSYPPTKKMEYDYTTYKNKERIKELEDKIDAIDDELDTTYDIFSPGVRESWSRPQAELTAYRADSTQNMYALSEQKAELEAELRQLRRYTGGMMNDDPDDTPFQNFKHTRERLPRLFEEDFLKKISEYQSDKRSQPRGTHDLTGNELVMLNNFTPTYKRLNTSEPEAPSRPLKGFRKLDTTMRDD